MNTWRLRWWLPWMCAAWLLGLACCSKPAQTANEAKAGFVAAFDTGDPADLQRYVYSRDPEAVELLKALITRTRQRKPPPEPQPPGLPAPHAGLMASLSQGIIKPGLLPVVEEQRSGDRLVQKYSTGKSTWFLLVDGAWKVDLDATPPGEPSFKEQIKMMLQRMDSDAAGGAPGP